MSAKIEAIITIGDRQLTIGQAKVVRTALLDYLAMLEENEIEITELDQASKAREVLKMIKEDIKSEKTK